jgi:hypothetical protein
MDNQVIIPELNPLFFVDKERALLPQYNTKHDDEFLEPESRKKWQGAGRYFQKWQTTDIISLQFRTNVAPVTFKLFDCKGTLVDQLVFTQKQRDRYNPELFIYECNFSLAGLSRGRYRPEVTFGNPVIDSLEWDFIDVADNWPDTVLIEYQNSFYYGDTLFGTGYSPTFRVEGWLKKQAPASKDELYTDQTQNQRLLFSDPYKVYKFIVGPSSGVPGWVGDKLNWIFGCDELYIDGKAFAKAGEGAKWETEEIEGHPFEGLSINLQEQNRRSGRIFPLDPTIGGKKLLVALNVETEGFADTSLGSSSNVIQINSVET